MLIFIDDTVCVNAKHFYIKGLSLGYKSITHILYNNWCEEHLINWNWKRNRYPSSTLKKIKYRRKMIQNSIETRMSIEKHNTVSGLQEQTVEGRKYWYGICYSNLYLEHGINTHSKNCNNKNMVYLKITNKTCTAVSKTNLCN